MAESESRLAYRPALDGVRALAVIAVLAFHDGRLPGGFLGVSVFFTLSGFLITGLLLSERASTGRVALGRFFTRRARRLLPAAMAGVALAALVTPLIAGPNGAPGFRGDGFAALANVANWRFVFADRAYSELFAAPSAVLHFWSLAVEEQFYFVLAPAIALLLWLGRGRRRVAAAGLVVLAIASFWAGVTFVANGSVDRAYYGTDVRAFEFLVGALLAVIYTGRTLGARTVRTLSFAGPIALTLLAWATVHARETDPALFRGGLAIHAVLVAVLLLAACEQSPLQRVLSVEPLRVLGRMSYGVYVYHWPLFLLFESTWAKVASTAAVAFVSYHLLECPIREGRSIFGPRAWRLLPVGAAAACIAVAVAAARTPANEIVYEPVTSSASAAVPGVELEPVERAPAALVGAEAAPATPAGKRLLIVGDSVGLTLGRGIERWGIANGVTVHNGGALGCSLLTDVHVRGYWGVKHRPYDFCNTATAWPKVIDEFQPDAVVVIFGAWDVYDASWDGGDTWTKPGDAEWMDHYAATVKENALRLGAPDRPLLWLAPPCYTALPGDDNEGADWFDPARVRAQLEGAQQVAAETGITVSETLPQLECPTVDIAARPDGVHYSDEGADQTTTALTPELTDLLLRR